MQKTVDTDQAIEDAFGLWISSLFSAIGGRNPELPFNKHVEVFFSVITQLLKAERIYFIAPDADCYTSPSNPHPRLTIEDTAARWNAPVEEIVSALRSDWPCHVDHPDHIDLLVYFYEIPGVIWVAADGTFVGS
ncbi:hypothetical protein [Rhizobium sp. 18055]|uniref:hypothetical protein n=1 Tax=Rhizobium sp. 18055 TaxID=2681403 RepID=UPI001359E8DF|nr:hypothetical protein [Rhizobium sp. 18055]